MLYIFAGYPKTNLNAGGLQYAIEQQLSIALLEHDSNIQYQKAGVFLRVGHREELLYPFECILSDLCLRDGITQEWFPDGHDFGNGVTIHKTVACIERKTVVHGTDFSLEEVMEYAGPLRLSDLTLERKHIVTEGWAEYEKRWLPGTCPRESHIVHLTWLVTKHRLPLFAYEKVRQLIEVPGQTVDERLYEPKHFSEVRRWNGKPSFSPSRTA